ncbi:MAG: protein kinase, partial [Proteobacteria bacterium]|nr:protein kinase [Pseudomonadota bacterium]
FESGKGISADKGTLGISLQTPRALTDGDVELILDAIREDDDDGDQLAVESRSLIESAETSVPSPAPSTPKNVRKPAPKRSIPPMAPASRVASGRPSANARPPRDPRAPSTGAPRVLGGKYEVIRQLGKGGMGVVYEARHTGTGRLVAIKEILSSTGVDPTLVERFQREARATGAIDTQYIASVLDTDIDGETGHPYMVIELLKGEDLQERIVRYGALSEDVAVRIAAQACSGLVRAHQAGVVHRDIKPANLYLARRDDEVVVKLLDFGLARVKEQMKGVENRTLTATGVMLGTPLYMSPEQVVGAKDLDHRTDLWALGVVLYEALTTETPHDDSETLGALLVSICSKPARPIRELAPHVTEPVARIVGKALQLDKAKRYQSADEMLADLKDVVRFGIRLDEAQLAQRPYDLAPDDGEREPSDLFPSDFESSS